MTGCVLSECYRFCIVNKKKRILNAESVSVFQYAADAQDKQWLAERQHMRATGGKMVRICVHILYVKLNVIIIN